MPRNKWLLGHIYDVITGKDGTVRGRKLFVRKTKKKKTVEHPINKLYPVEYFVEFTVPAKDQNIRQQLRREAAFLAEIKNKFYKLTFINPFSANVTKWSNRLKQFVDKFSTNCLSVFDNFVALACKRLSDIDL